MKMLGIDVVELCKIWGLQEEAEVLTLKAPIMTAADDKFCDIFPNF